MDVTTLKARIANYFDDRGNFNVKNRHAVNMFVSRVNRYVTAQGCVRGTGTIDPENTPAPKTASIVRCAARLSSTRRGGARNWTREPPTDSNVGRAVGRAVGRVVRIVPISSRHATCGQTDPPPDG